MKKSEMYKKTIIDVIHASTGVKITDEIFEQLIMLFDAYEFQCFVREKKLGEKKNS